MCNFNGYVGLVICRHIKRIMESPCSTMVDILHHTSLFGKPGSLHAKIFITLRGHSQVHDLDRKSQRLKPNRVISLNIDRYRKAVYRVLWVQLALVVCYLPYIISEALTSKGRITVSAYLARQFSITIAYLNSSLNPVLYCWKIREVRQAVKGIIRQIFCSST